MLGKIVDIWRCFANRNEPIMLWVILPGFVGFFPGMLLVRIITKSFNLDTSKAAAIVLLTMLSFSAVGAIVFSIKLLLRGAG